MEIPRRCREHSGDYRNRAPQTRSNSGGRPFAIRSKRWLRVNAARGIAHALRVGFSQGIEDVRHGL
jgi:hypothetical protein